MTLSQLNQNLLLLKFIPTIGDGTILKILEAYREHLEKVPLEYSLVKDLLTQKQRDAYKSSILHFQKYFNKLNEDLVRNNISLTNILDDCYPESLKKIYSPPVLLFYKGSLEYDYFKSLAVVGTRAFTSYGEKQCEKLIEQLAQSKFTIVSGLALGIDSIAHQTALKKHLKCIGVVGQGLNFAYPATNHLLYQKILENNGCIISQFLPDMIAKAENFPLRNRIIAALSRGTLVVESADKSGSLITAKYAFDFDREVFALPADLTREKSIGCNLLIKNQIAKLVTSSQDILSEFGISKPIKQANLRNNLRDLNPSYKRILDLLSFDNYNLDQIASQLKENVNTVSVLLTEMELESLVLKDDQGFWLRI